MARRDGGRAEMRSDEVRFSTSSAKNKTKASISTRGTGRKSSWLASIFGGGLDFGARRVKKKKKIRDVEGGFEECVREMERDGEGRGADRRKRDRCAATC